MASAWSPTGWYMSSVKVGENHVVLGYGRERPMYCREHALVLMGKCVRANMRWNLGQTVPARAGDPTADSTSRKDIPGASHSEYCQCAFSRLCN